MCEITMAKNMIAIKVSYLKKKKTIIISCAFKHPKKGNMCMHEKINSNHNNFAIGSEKNNNSKVHI